jgi:hypothetical protein
VADVQAFDTEQRSQCGVGRLVSRYVGEPAPTLRALVHYLKPDGTAAFQQIVLSSVRSVPPLPFVGRVGQWVIAAFERAVAEVDMGLNMPYFAGPACLPRSAIPAAPHRRADSAG